MSFHTIIVVGNLGREPEMRYLNTGTAVTSFSLATNRKYTDNSGQQVKETVWFNVSVWGKQAESCNNFLHKGSQVVIEGRLRPDAETGGPHVFTRSDGTTGARYEITAQSVHFLSSGNHPEGQEPGATGSEEEPKDQMGSGEDIPF